MKKNSYIALGLLLFITTGYTATSLPGTVKWTFPIQGVATNAPAIATDGTIYAPSSNQFLWAINPDGTKKWATYTQYPITSTPMIASSDGSIFLSTNDVTQSLLYKILPTGAVAWAKQVAPIPPVTPPMYQNIVFNLISAPTLSNNLIMITSWVEAQITLKFPPKPVYFTSVIEVLSYLDQNTGNPIYNYRTLNISSNIYPNVISTVPLSWLHAPYVNAIANIAMTTSNNLDAGGNLTAAGLFFTNYVTGNSNNTPMPVADPSKITSPTGNGDNLLYVGDTAGDLFKYDGMGNLMQIIHVGGDISHAAPVVDPTSGIVYVGSDNGHLYAICSDGTLCWDKMVDTYGITKSVALNKEGVVYVVADSGNVYALDQHGNALWSQPLDVNAITTPAIGPDGTVYVGTNVDTIVAINGEPLSEK